MADGHVMGRGGRFRSPPPNPINGNTQANLEEKLASLSITEVSFPPAGAHFHVTHSQLVRFHVRVERQSRATPGKQW